MKRMTLVAAAFMFAPARLSAQGLDYSFYDSYPLLGKGYFYSVAASTAPSWVFGLKGKLPAREAPAYTPGGALELRYVSSPGGSWRALLQRRPIRGQDEWDNGVYIQKKDTPFKKPEILHFRLFVGMTPPASLPRVMLALAGGKFSGPVSMVPFLSEKDERGWSRVRIPLSAFPGSGVKAAEEVIGIAWEQGGSDGREHSLYVDQVDLRPEKDPELPPSLRPELLAAKGYERHVDLSWTPAQDPGVQGVLVERSSDGKDFQPVGIRPRRLSRYADWVGSPGKTFHYRIRLLGYDGKTSLHSSVLKASTRELGDDGLLDMVQEACLRYYWDGAEENSGLALESIPGDPHMVAVGASGFGIMALVVGAERGFIPKEGFLSRMDKILSFLERSDRFHGVMPHYYQGLNGHPQLFFGPDDNGGDLVETSFLMQGLLTARQSLSDSEPKERRLRERITRVWQDVEWSWYREKPDSAYLYWHWSPDKAFKIHHPLIGWNESLITYLLGMASPTHPIPVEMYRSGWASQAKEAQDYRGGADGKMYGNGKSYYGVPLAVGGFSGGPIFFTHYSFLGLDPRGLRDEYADYFENNKAIATINLRYCQENPLRRTGYGDDGWGLTASDAPWGYNPDEPRPEMDRGKLTPTGAIASMPYLPDEAMAALKNYYRNHGRFLWGEYGFRDAFDLDQDWVNDLWMGLNQAPMVVMIENHRTGLPWKLFMSSPEVQAMRSKVFKRNTLRVLSLNILVDGGSDRLNGIIDLIRRTGADVVGLQEAESSAAVIARALGFRHIQQGGSTALLSRYDIESVTPEKNGAVIRMGDNRRFTAFNLHLYYEPYQPYQLLGIPYTGRFIKTEAEAVKESRKARGKGVKSALSDLADLKDPDVPIVLTGDFNEPSHLDWTEAAAKAGHHPIKVEWPSTKALADAGFKDSFREKHPDPVADPGCTWTPTTRPDDPKDHHDRIDFVLFRGKKLELRSSVIVGEDSFSPYPTDHRGVLAEFELGD